MGGIVKAVAKAVGISKPKAPPVQKVAQTAKNVAASTGKKVNAITGGYGQANTMMSSVTEEANVGKTILGGAEAKGKKKMSMSNLS